MSVIRLTNRSG